MSRKDKKQKSSQKSSPNAPSSPAGVETAVDTPPSNTETLVIAVILMAVFLCWIGSGVAVLMGWAI